MTETLFHYLINENTMALLPAAHIEYSTIVWERDRQLFVKQKPIEIIRFSCLDDYSSYEGRREAVSHHTKAKRKIPVPINIDKKIYAFPTNSPTLYECQWIFYYHVQSVDRISRAKKDGFQSFITFKNGQEMKMKETYYVLDKQMLRTAMCIQRFSDHLKRAD